MLKLMTIAVVGVSLLIGGAAYQGMEPMTANEWCCPCCVPGCGCCDGDQCGCAQTGCCSDSAAVASTTDAKLAWCCPCCVPGCDCCSDGVCGCGSCCCTDDCCEHPAPACGHRAPTPVGKKCCDHCQD